VCKDETTQCGIEQVSYNYVYTNLYQGAFFSENICEFDAGSLDFRFACAEDKIFNVNWIMNRQATIYIYKAQVSLPGCLGACGFTFMRERHCGTQFN
jgi:hypothetical protein